MNYQRKLALSAGIVFLLCAHWSMIFLIESYKYTPQGIAEDFDKNGIVELVTKDEQGREWKIVITSNITEQETAICESKNGGKGTINIIRSYDGKPGDALRRSGVCK